MKCDDIQLLLPDFEDNLLAPADAERVRQHLAACPACAREAEAQRRLNAAFRHARTPQPGPRLHSMFQTWLEAEEEAAAFRTRTLTTPRQSWLRNLMTPGLSAVAACALFVVGLVVGGRILSQPVTPARDEAAAQEIAKLRTELETMSKTVAFSLLQQQQSTSDRLQTVRALDTASTAAPRISELLTVLAYDASPTVRRSAVEALYRYAGEPTVPRALATALPRENSPVVQFAMIDLLGASRDPVAVSALASFAQSDATLPALRDAANQALARM